MARNVDQPPNQPRWYDTHKKALHPPGAPPNHSGANLGRDAIAFSRDPGEKYGSRNLPNHLFHANMIWAVPHTCKKKGGKQIKTQHWMEALSKTVFLCRETANYSNPHLLAQSPRQPDIPGLSLADLGIPHPKRAAASQSSGFIEVSKGKPQKPTPKNQPQTNRV